MTNPKNKKRKRVEKTGPGHRGPGPGATGPGEKKASGDELLPRHQVSFLTGTGKYLPLIAIMAALLAVLYLIFGPKISTLYKKKQIKNLKVILITLDTLRQDYVGAYGKGKAETPHIDRVAEEGVRFDTCISQTPLTLPSHTSILSGTYPLHHQIRDNGGFLVPASLELVSEVLKKHGWITSAFIASYVLHSKWGINQGFDTYSDEFDLSKYERISLGNVQKRADEVLGNAQSWLKTHKNERFFTWIHLYDPHTPYDPPSPFKEKHPRQPYRGEVEYLDQELGKFFRFLKEEDLYDQCLLILAADHGEGLGEHNENAHGFFIYETTVRVPLIIRAPFRFPVQHLKNIVELIDLAPTILEAVDVPVPDSYQGQSLLGLMWGDTRKGKETAYTETYFPRLHFGWSELKALYHDNHWKYIQAPKEELYDLETDHGESNSLALKKSYQTGKVKERIRKFIREKSRGAREPGEAKNLDKSDIQKLAALGYLTTVVDTSNKTDLPDPKGKVGVFNQLDQAKEYMAKEQYDQAIALLKKILEAEPHLVDGILQLGNVYVAKKMYREALDWFYRILDQKPDYQAVMVNILGALTRMGQFDKGIAEAQRFLKIFPGDFTLLNELGTFYGFKHEQEKALETFRQSVEIEPVNPHALIKMSDIYVDRKEFNKAEPLLNQVLAINPSLKKLYFYLAQVEEARGNIQKAIDYYRKELENTPEDFKAAYNLAEYLRERGQAEESLQYYRKSMESNPRFNIPYFMIANYYLQRRENLEEAVELCNKGIQIEPFDKYTVFGYYVLSDIYSLKGNPSASGTYFAKGEALKRELIKKNKW